MEKIIVDSAEREPGLYAKDYLIADWATLAKTNQVILRDTTLTRCYLDDPGNLVLPEGITEIGDGCFKECSNLYSVTLPTTVKEVGFGAFYGCTDMEYIAVKDISAISSIKFR